MTDITFPSGPTVDSAGGPLQLPAPTVDAVLPDIPGGETNLLPVSALNDDLRVVFPLWEGSNPQPGAPETLTLMWNGQAVAQKAWTAPVADADRFILLPSEHLREGIHVLHYEVENWIGNSEGSHPLPLTIDTTPPQYPANPAKLKFPTQVEIAGITRQYLENNDNQVIADVPDYGFKPGDRLVAYWEDYPDGEHEVLDVELTTDLEVIFGGDMIEAEGNGERAVTYRLLDRAGNVSSLSSSQRLKVDIQPPALRPMPSVPQADAGSPAVLDPRNTTSGVTARVPEQADDISRTEITLFWKGYGEAGSFQTVTPTVPGGLDFRIPAAAIPANFGRELEVFYSVAFLDFPDNEAEVSDVYPLCVVRLEPVSFPNISCAQSVNGVVSLAAVPAGGAAITIPAWPYKAVAAGMRINVWMTGLDHQGVAIREDLLVAEPVPADTQSVTTTLAKAVLQRVKIASSFTLRAQVSFDEGDSYMAHRLLDLRMEP